MTLVRVEFKKYGNIENPLEKIIVAVEDSTWDWAIREKNSYGDLYSWSRAFENGYCREGYFLNETVKMAVKKWYPDAYVFTSFGLERIK